MNKEEQIKKLLSKTVGPSQYNGWNNRTAFGYHSYNIGDVSILGQRNPNVRLRNYKKHIDFKNKVVLDFGCNVGAMLHHLENIKLGIGFDYDKNCINAAIEISKILGRNNLNFFAHDFDKNEYSELKNKISEKPDIIFLLSLGSWVKSWEKLYSLCCDFNCIIVLEVNNEEEGSKQLDFFKKRGLNTELILDNSLDDCTGNNRRRSYIIKPKNDYN